MISFLFLDLRTLIFLITLYDSSGLYLSENADGTHYYKNENRIRDEYHKNKVFYSEHASDTVENSLKYFSDFKTTQTPSKNSFKTNNDYSIKKYFEGNFKNKNNRSDLVNKTTTELPFSIILDTPPLVDSSTEIIMNDSWETTGDNSEYNETESRDDDKDVWYISVFKLVRKLLIECRTRSMGEETSLSYLMKMQRCAREKILMAVDRALQADELRLSDSVYLVKEENNVNNDRYL